MNKHTKTVALLVIGAEAVSFQHSGQRAPQYLTSQNGTNPETTAHADEYEEGYVPEDATSEEHWKEDEWVGDEEHKEWDEHDLENKHFDPEKVCTLGDPNQCTSWGDDCCGSMEWDEPQTCAEGYYPVDMGNCIYRCIPNECGEWVPEEEEESDKPVMDYEMPFYETEFMIWHKHWKSMSLDPMGVWIMPSKGSTSDNEGVFAIGWMYSDNIDGTGIWQKDNEEPSTYTFYVNNNPEQKRMFYPQAFFDWDGEWGPGLPEPTASKWMTNDGFYLWEKSEPKYEDFGECRCFANGPENEEFCEGGELDEDECVNNDRCHWGPGENAECESANHFEDPEDWADEETIQDWAPEEMDAEEVAYVVEEQQEQLEDLGDAVGDMQEQINEIYDKLEGAYEEEYDDYDYEEGYDKESDEDYMCELKKDMVKGVFILADQDGDNKVTKEEMTSTLDLAESVDFEMMLEQLFSMADDDMSGEVDYDELWWLMDYKKDSGELSPEDAWAIESVLEWADAELGDHNQKFSLEEAMSGVSQIVQSVKYDMGVDTLFAYVDSNQDNTMSVEELEAILPTIC